MLLFRNILVFVLLAFSLQSCGFKPVYGKKGFDNQEVKDGMEQVKVTPIKSLLGQTYVVELENILNPLSKNSEKKYVLNAKLRESVYALDIQQNSFITRYGVTMTVEYSLVEIATGKVLIDGTLNRDGGYDRVQSDYGTYVSENDVKTRLVKELAQDTKMRVAFAVFDEDK